jgi:predicted DNA-binding transcriptional regulator YafY
MLQMIPRDPGGLSINELREKLAMSAPEYDVHKRTIERNLMQLMSIFPSLNYRESSKGNLWFWEKDTVMDVPRLDAKTALMFRLARDYLSPVLPRAAMNELRPHFQQAERTLKELRERAYISWPDKVMVIQNSIQLGTPEIDPIVLGTIYDALFEDRKVSIKYRPREGGEKSYVASILGLVFRDGSIYAVSSLEDREHIRQLPIHRILSADALDNHSDTIKGFVLEEYVRKYFDYPVKELKSNASYRDEIKEDMSVTLAFSPISAVHLHESPLAPDQSYERLPDGREAFTATLANTERLRWWILSYGPQVEVIGPDDLREEIKERLMAAIDSYRK